MGKERLAAFSDGVIAIIITIMVLELKVPHGSDSTALMAVTPNFVSYVLSFIYLAIYWNNHHRWRGPVEARLANMPCLIGMEACIGVRHLSRKLRAFGHDARLMPAGFFCRSLLMEDRASRHSSRHEATSPKIIIRPAEIFTPLWDELGLVRQ